jgi:hypothetical protein
VFFEAPVVRAPPLVEALCPPEYSPPAEESAQLDPPLVEALCPPEYSPLEEESTLLDSPLAGAL